MLHNLIVYAIVIGIYFVLFTALGPILTNGILIILLVVKAIGSLITICSNGKFTDVELGAGMRLARAYLFGIMPALCLVGYFTHIPIVIATVLFELICSKYEKVSAQ